MPRISQEALEEVQAILAEYDRVLREAGMTDDARGTAFGDVERFTCWLDHCYQPMKRSHCRCPVNRGSRRR